MSDPFTKWNLEVDLVAVGSSSGGLVGAIVGHDFGLKTVVLEKADALGGATAISAGVIWIPYNHHMLEMGLSDSRDEALTYIRRIAMGRHEEEKLAAYLENGPKMLRYLEKHTPLQMIVVPGCPDYRGHLPGGKLEGRYLLADPVNTAVELADAEERLPFLKKVRKTPVPYLIGEITGLPEEIWAAGRSLIGTLVWACLDRGIEIFNNTRAIQLIVNEGRAIGVRAEKEGKDFFVKSKRGVLLATGGYEWNSEMNKKFLHGPSVHAFTCPQNEGDGHIMGMEIGAAVALMDHSLWCPVIRVPGEEIDGKPYYRPFVHECGKPGQILVNRHGKRCCDEGFYPDIACAFIAYDSANSEWRNLPMFWIADQSNRDKYRLGPLAEGEVADWLYRADTLRKIAEKLGIPPDNLEQTVEGFNRFAREGKDHDFHRGETPWGKFMGDPDVKGNPCMGPLENPPFYGIQVFPGTSGHQGGLVTNGNAQALNVRGKAIPGLYVTGNTTAHSVVGFSFNTGIAIGQSMIFGYVAANQIAKGL